MYDYEIEDVEDIIPKDPKRSPRIMYSDFLTIVSDAEAFEGGLCLQLDPEYMFGENRCQESAKLMCWTPCPVREKCLKHALENEIPHGVWGGFTERERKGMRRLVS